MTSCSLVPQKKGTLGPVLVQFWEKKTEFRFQFHFWFSKLDPVPDHYFPNFYFIFKNLSSGYRTDVNLKPSSDYKNDSSLILGNQTEINASNQPNKPGKHPTLVGKPFALVKPAVGHMENPCMFVFHSRPPPTPHDTRWLFQFGNGPAQRVYSFRIYLIGTL